MNLPALDSIVPIVDIQRPIQGIHLSGPGMASGASLREAAHQFESYFISHLLKVMRETVPKNPFDGKGGAYFYSFYDQELGRLASEAGGIGMARMIQEYAEKNLLPPGPAASSPHPGQPIEEAMGVEPQRPGRSRAANERSW